MEEQTNKASAQQVQNMLMWDISKLINLSVTLHLNFDYWSKAAEHTILGYLTDDYTGKWGIMSNSLRNKVKTAALKFGYEIYENSL